MLPNPTRRASSLPGKCLPARSRQGPTGTMGMVRQPAWAWELVRALQTAVSPPLSLRRAIFLLPEDIVHFVLHLQPRAAPREADRKPYYRSRPLGQIDAGLLGF